MDRFEIKEVHPSMSEKQVWLVTGAGRGMGVDIAKAALDAGNAVVATGRNPEKVSSVLGAHDDLLVVALDVTDPASAGAAVHAERGPVRPDRRAGQQRGQFQRRVLRGAHPGGIPGADRAPTLFGPVNVTRAALPICAPSALV